MPKIFSICLLSFFLSGCGESFQSYSQDQSAQNALKLLKTHGGPSGLDYFKLPRDISKIPQDPNNQISIDKIELGKMLFHDPIIAVNNKDPQNRMTYSCSSCHSPHAGFASENFQGIAEGGFDSGSSRSFSPFSSFFDVQPMKVPPTLNISFQKNLLWSGALGASHLNSSSQALWTPGTPPFFNTFGYEGAETQALAGQMVHGLLDQSSPSANTASLTSDVFTNQKYLDLFQKAFPNKNNNDLISQETVALAIAAYDRSILSTEAPFQKFIHGDYEALTSGQLKGLNIFFKKGKCYECHTGPALNSMEFHSLGFNDFNSNKAFIKPGDEASFLGRGSFTGNSTDDYKFKVPQLYNVKDHFSHGHGGSFKSIREVIEYKNKAISQNPLVPNNKISPLFVPLNLSPDEITYLVDFLENALYDPNLVRFQPKEVPSYLCFLSSQLDGYCH